MMQLNAKANALLTICNAILETVKEADQSIGAPAGPLYMAMQHGLNMTLDQFEQIMGLLVQSGRLRKSGHCYFYVPK